jgi:iron complex outermembrane receptor protein
MPIQRQLRLGMTVVFALPLSGFASEAAAPAQSEPMIIEIPVDTTQAAPEVVRSISSKLDGQPHTQPLSIVSETRANLEAKGARELTQAIETVASANVPVSFQLQPAGQYGLRGFDAAILHDGFQSLTLAGDRDALIGIDRIDFIKGPGSALNSGTLGLPPGGAIEIHSAWAGTSRSLRVQRSRSRYQQETLSAELDTGDLMPVVSLAAGYERAEGLGFFDFSRLDREKKRASLSLRGLGSRISFYAEESERIQKDHPGLPTTGTLNRAAFTIPDSRSVMDPDVPLSSTQSSQAGIDLDIPFARYLTLTGGLRHLNSRVDQFAQYLSSNQPDFPLDPSNQTWMRSAGDYHQETQEDQAHARLTVRFDTQRLGSYNSWVGYGGEDAPDYATIGIGLASPINLVNPTYGSWGAGALLPFGQAKSHFRIRNLSSGIQWRWNDQINLFYSQTDTDARIRNNQTVINNDYLASVGLPLSLPEALLALQQSPLLPNSGTSANREDHYNLVARQYGIAAKLWDLSSNRESDGIWAFYGQGNGHQFQAYYTGNAAPKPELSNQREAGLRLMQSDWGNLQSAAFEINRRNVRTLDPNGITGFETVTTGLQSIRGIDLEGAFRVPYPIWDRFSLTASAAWLRSRIDEDNNFASGNALTNVPRQNWRLQLNADVLRGAVPVTTFAAQRCRSSVQGDLQNSFTVPGRCLIDIGATMLWQGFSVDAVVRNISDERYYEPYAYLFNGIIPGERQTVRLSLSYRFDSRSANTGGFTP